VDELKQKDLVYKLLYKAKLGLNDGLGFGKNAKGFMRMNIALPKKELEFALDRFELLLTQ